MPTTRKGVWDLQQVRDQILDNVWEQQFELFCGETTEAMEVRVGVDGSCV